MFTERLNQLITFCGAKNRQIALSGKIDPSLLSHLRNGFRVPEKDSPSIEKVTSAIYLYMDSRNEIEKLCSFLEIDPGAETDEIIEKMKEWLYFGHSSPSQRKPRVNNTNKSKRSGSSKNKKFGSRLDATMSLASISNIRFSNLIKVDPSLISRFRSGIRTPNSNPVIAKSISSVLWNRISSMDKLPELSDLMGVTASDLNQEAFHNWLCDFDDRSMVYSISATERLLDAFDSYSTVTGKPLPAFEEAAPLTVLNDKSSEYLCYEGLRNAVLRFLGTAVKERAKELLLYSDQNMEWMISDDSFLLKWAALMSACVKNGTRIKIIHNLDRDLNEMYNAIISWVPLYLSGMVESYYSTLEKGQRTSFTLFLNPGTACISSSNVIGTEKHGRYRYDTEEEDLALGMEQFSSLMKNASPLVSISDEDIPFVPDSDTTIIQPALSMLTMPKSLINELDSPERFREWQRKTKAFDYLMDYSVCECIPLADDERLFSGKIPFENLRKPENCYYTSEQYSDHIRNIINLLKKYPGYKLVPLPEVPFNNVKLLLCKDMVKVTCTSEPFVSLSFRHPKIVSAFQDYTVRLIDKYKKDHKTLIKDLENRYF